jgi:Na+-driven multidrug efflux pump
MKKYSGIELMEKVPAGTAIIRLALPMIAAMLAQSIYNMTDMFFIGQTGDPNMVAAVSLVFPLFMLSQALGNIFAVGSSSYISRMLGAKKNDEARLASSVSFYTAFGAGLLVTMVLRIFKTPVLHLIGASGATFAYLYATAVCITGSVILRLFGGRFIRFFINDGPTVDAGTAMMHTFVWGLAFVGSQITLSASPFKRW